ncbi:MAG: efflux RND transporter periplasmic adaptor subunit [Deltaproteobacteria bacterium]|nr:efflux RND transporter periplasmic adaptor subunit [Deltaproteobacteria bacterium]
MRSVLTVVVAAAAVAGGVWAIKRGTADPPISFKTARVDRGPVEQAVTATGSVSAVVTVQVGSQVSGVIAKLGADFNSRVTAGQIIAQIDPTRFKATVAQNEATLKGALAAEGRVGVAVRQAKLDRDRAEALVNRQVLGAAELDLARTKYDQSLADQAEASAKIAQARASLGAARVDLERTTIRAPIAGTVLQRSVDVGQTVAASLQAPVLFTIAQDLARMEVHAAIDEADVGKIREGQEATFTVDAYPGETFRATIFQIRSQPNVQQNVVTYDAVVRFDNPDSKLRPGMTATVRVVSLRKDDVLRVPNAALRFKPATELVAAVPARPMDERNVTAIAPGAARAANPAMPARPENPPGPMGLAGKENAGRAGGPPGTGARTRGRLFRPAGNKVTPVVFKPGISDDEFTEVAGGELNAGDEIVLDVSGGPARSGPSGAPMGGARRPPRMF